MRILPSQKLTDLVCEDKAVERFANQELRKYVAEVFEQFRLMFVNPISFSRLVEISGETADLYFIETDAAADQTTWRIHVNSEELSLDLVDDAISSATSVLRFTRTNNTCDLFAVAATSITLNGVASSDFARLSQDNVFIQSDAGQALLRQQNSSTGAAATSRVAAQNSAHEVVMIMASTGYSGALLSSGPSGEQAAIFVDAAVPLSLATNSTSRLVIDGSGNLDFKSGLAVFGNRVRLFGYTVATLPAGTIGDTAYVTDALAPVFGAAVAGGGAVMVPVYYTGAAWFVG